MKYSNIKEAIFLNRPNRFIAKVRVDGHEEMVHVKNTGRCREILQEGTPVYLEESSNPSRKTRYSLIAAWKGPRLINIDSQAPNTVVFDALQAGHIRELPPIDLIRREVFFGSSRFDLFFRSGTQSGFIEVKGVTLERDGGVLFPDAPTERGTRHVKEMVNAVAEGCLGVVFLLVQMKGVKVFTPNRVMDPAFSNALDLAAASGVQILCYDCHVAPDEIRIGDPVEVKL